VFVVMEHRSRRLVHYNVTAHPTARWTVQQLREAVGFETRYTHLRHDRDSIFAKPLDDSVKRLGITVVKSPPHCPTANSICERRASAHGIGSGCSGSSAHLSQLSTAQFPPSPRGIIRGPSQFYSRRAASRIFSRARLRLTGYLRTTGLLNYYNCAVA